MLKRFAIGLVLAFLVALPATAQDYERGFVAAKYGDYETAFREWRPLAEQGDAVAQHNVGVLYLKGWGVPRDNVLAYMWFTLAAMIENNPIDWYRAIAARRMTPTQIVKAQKLARQWWAKHLKA